MSDIYLPIIDSVESAETTDETGDVVGLIAGHVYWRDLIRDILPQGADGIDVVFDSGCRSSFTYRLYGPAVKFRGSGDKHESKYDYLRKSSNVTDLNSVSTSDSRYVGVDISEFCPMTIHLYPSNVMADLYYTRNAFVFAFVAVAIFVVTSGT